MPYKYHQTHGHHIPQSSSNSQYWPNYNKNLKRRGEITLWLSEDAIEQWYEQERVYKGTGAPKLYSDLAVLTVHEIRQVFKLPLHQCEGFINSLFVVMKIKLCCPSYSTLSKRLKTLNLI